MDKMLKMMDEMMDKMCGEDRMKLMKKVLEKCMSGMSPEQCAEAAKDVFPGGAPKCGAPKDEAAWEQMPNMIMSMMGMMCVRMMNDMAGEKSAGATSGMGGAMNGMMGGRGMGGMMGGGGPMKMMQKMMQNFGAQQAGESGEAKPGDSCNVSDKNGDSG